MTTQIEKCGWNVDEWCQSAGISRRTVYTLISDNKLKIVKIGRRTIIPEHPRDFLQRMATEAA